MAGPSAPVRPPLTSEQERIFETRIRPILALRCAGCHAGNRPAGGLRVDSRAALERGGKRGAALHATKPDESLLLQAVLRQRPGLAMPPQQPLSEEETQAFTAWIRAGAPWPSAHPKPVDPRSHWAFQAVRRVPIPTPRDVAWCRTPIDRFLRQAQEAKGLQPVRDADRRTLLRRVSIDLIGLPPSSDETRAFLADRSPTAWSKVVERLLASPRYGERWGRHWLDVARYADTNGLDENVHYGNAWRYRDYVVQAFQDDLPYRDFLIEQIAGDLLPSSEDATLNRRRLIATGYLAIGPKCISEVDSRRMEMDAIDEQLDSLGRATLGMTFGCARCHDHKFDPITTRDYYGLAGILKSSRFMTIMTKPRMWFEHPIATQADRDRVAAHAAALAGAKEQLAAELRAGRSELQRVIGPGKPLPTDFESSLPEARRTRLKQIRDQVAAMEKSAPELPGAMGLTEGEPTDLQVHIRGSFLELGERVPRRFPTVLAGASQPALPSRGSGRHELAQWIASPEHPLTGRVIVNRVWRWHFGRGIVATPDNFGIQGDRPSHPELLDWLAGVFVGAVPHRLEDGRAFKPWSIKDLHRLILSSRAFGLADRTDERMNRLDPENRLLARWTPQRLDAESLRDSLLFVSGRLDLRMGGPALPLKNREYVFDHTSTDRTSYDSVRRTLYLPVVRNHVYDYLEVFDFGDGAVPSGDRTSTTVPAQALFMMNAELVLAAADQIAASVRNASADVDSRIDRAYELCLGRAPADRERAVAHRLLGQRRALGKPGGPSEEDRAWSLLCHTLLCTNEFAYVR